VSADVVPIGPGVEVSLALADIPAMLRGAADDLERAMAEGTFAPDLAVLVLSAPGQRVPSVRTYGRQATEAEVDGLMMQAIMFPAFGLNP
jgi:hypothetical protein